MNKKLIKRGDLYYANLNPVIGSEQGEIRPCLVAQNETGNKHSPTVVVVPLTCNIRKNPLPTHVFIPQSSGLEYDSVALAEQVRTIDRSRLDVYIGRIDREKQFEVDVALAISIGIEKQFSSKGELFELCLCSHCENNFRNAGCVVVKKGWQAIKEECDFCKLRRGVTFGIFGANGVNASIADT